MFIKETLGQSVIVEADIAIKWVGSQKEHYPGRIETNDAVRRKKDKTDDDGVNKVEWKGRQHNGVVFGRVPSSSSYYFSERNKLQTC